MARTRFMPPPQIGFAGQTYRTFGDPNRCMGQIRRESWESVLDRERVSQKSLSIPARHPAPDQTNARPQAEHFVVRCAAVVHAMRSPGYAGSC